MLDIRLPRTVVFTLVTIALASVADAQVSARQGEQDRTQFESPMILDLPLTVTDKTIWGKGLVRSKNETALRKYSCDGVSFVDFATSAKRQRDGNVKITFDFMLATESGMDKLASVKIAIVDGEREVARGTRADIDAEEGKHTGGQIVIVVREATLTADPARTLRITLKVTDNP
jgi:hypothetical protein